MPQGIQAPRQCSYRRNEACPKAFKPHVNVPTVGTRPAPTQVIPTVGTRRAPSHSYRRTRRAPSIQAPRQCSYRRNEACPKAFKPQVIPTVETRRAPRHSGIQAPRQCSYRRNEACPKSFLPQERGVPQGIQAPCQCSYHRNEACPKAFKPHVNVPTVGTRRAPRHSSPTSMFLP